MRTRNRWVAAALVVLIYGAAPPTPDPMTANPLHELGRLVGGEWHLDDSYHVFTWGVGQKSIQTRSYFVADGTPKLVSEGVWFWHPGDQTIKGYATAIDMPIDFFEYTTAVVADTITQDIVSYGPQGGTYRETWVFTDDDHYEWTLYAPDGTGWQRAGGGMYARKRS